MQRQAPIDVNVTFQRISHGGWMPAFAGVTEQIPARASMPGLERERMVTPANRLRWRLTGSV